MKSLIQIVNELIAQGHNVQYSIRKDGGILIRYIDGVHYKAADGNKRAREMVGAQLSEARAKQLKYITRVRKKSNKLPDAVNIAYQKAKVKWKKAFKSQKGKPHPAGYFDKRSIRYTYEKYGEEEALRVISEHEKYASGIAYSKNVEHLADFIQDAAAKYGSAELSKLAQDVRDNAFLIRDEWIYPAYEKLYDLNNGIDPKQVAQETRLILRL